MLKGNKKWKAMGWMERTWIVGTVLGVLGWWPLLNLFLLATDFDIHNFGFIIWALLCFLPWIVCALRIGYKEWFTE